MMKLFRKTSLNKNYYELCRTTKKYPHLARAAVQWFFYTECPANNLYRHLGWYIEFAKRHGLNVRVRG